jgi:hypothetical protein
MCFFPVSRSKLLASKLQKSFKLYQKFLNIKKQFKKPSESIFPFTKLLLHRKISEDSLSEPLFRQFLTNFSQTPLKLEKLNFFLFYSCFDYSPTILASISIQSYHQTFSVSQTAILDLFLNTPSKKSLQTIELFKTNECVFKKRRLRK